MGLQLRGHKNVVVVEPNEHRRERAEGLGFATASPDGAVDAVRTELGERPAVVFECSGAAAAVSLAVDMLDYHGRIVLLGRPMAPVPLPQAGVLVKELEIVGAVSCTAEEFREAIEHLASGAVDAGSIVTATVGLSEIDDAFEDLLAPSSRHLKVLVDPHR
jgi:threonine dehydrogenase-like Zn-dependent dehydrogenase